MTNKNISVLAVIFSIIIGIAFLFSCFHFQGEDELNQTGKPASEQILSAPKSPSSSAPQQAATSRQQLLSTSNKNIQQVSKPANAVNAALPESPEQASPEKCADCGERVLAFLADPANDEAAKVKMAQTWLKPETKEETLSLLRLLKEAHDAQQNDLKDRLLQMLAGTDSGESAELLISVLNGEQPDFSLKDLPEDLSYAIKKAVRLNPDENTGKRLAEELSYQRPEETLAAIQDVKRPDMIYELLAQETDQEKISGLVQSLQSYSDPRTLDVIMRLGNEKILTVEDAAKAAYDWADAHGESFNQERCEAYLSEPEASPAQRAVAAAALAAASDPSQAMTALQKAYEEETDQNLRLTYEEAISRARSRISKLDVSSRH